MRKFVFIAAVAGFALAVPSVSHAADQAETAAARAAGKGLGTSTSRAANNQTAVACNFCYTCGGDWPVFAGSMVLAAGARPTERGSSCGGTLRPAGGFASDSSPFMCCR